MFTTSASTTTWARVFHAETMEKLYADGPTEGHPYYEFQPQSKLIIKGAMFSAAEHPAWVTVVDPLVGSSAKVEPLHGEHLHQVMIKNNFLIQTSDDLLRVYKLQR